MRQQLTDSGSIQHGRNGKVGERGNTGGHRTGEAAWGIAVELLRILYIKLIGTSFGKTVLTIELLNYIQILKIHD